MAITTYAELQTAIANWLNRDDLTSRIPEFIALAEAEFNRTIYTPDTEGAVSSTLSAETLLLPTDFRQARSLYIADSSGNRRLLKQMSLPDLRLAYAESATSTPKAFAIEEGTTLVVGPAPNTSYTAYLNYFAKIPALSVSNTTNWLLTSHPDIYLYGSCLQADIFMVNDARLDLWQGKLAAGVSELERMGKRKHNLSDPQPLRSAGDEPWAAPSTFNINRGW
jgi:hypothetical protein